MLHPTDPACAGYEDSDLNPESKLGHQSMSVTLDIMSAKEGIITHS